MAESARGLIAYIAGGPEDEAVRASLEEALKKGVVNFCVAVCALPLFARLGDEDLEGVFTVLMTLVTAGAAGGPNLAEQDAATEAIAVALTSASDKPLLRLRIVTNVYNTVREASHKEAKLQVLKRLIKFASEHRLIETLQSFLAGAAGWPAKWALSAEQAGSLFLMIAQCMDRNGIPEEAQTFLIRYLGTLEGASAEALVAARPWAKTAALNFVKAPAVSQKSNLARLAAVRDAPPPPHPQMRSPPPPFFFPTPPRMRV
jgi:hypothetical protein